MSKCLTPTVKGSGGSVMLWGALSLHNLVELVPFKGRENKGSMNSFTKEYF